jgi:hypothetical protein
MGKSRTPKYVVHINGYTPFEWSVKYHGTPNDTNLQKYVEKFGSTLNNGGVNAHLFKDTCIVYPQSAIIRTNRAGGHNDTKATWKCPSFMVW